VCGLTCCSYLRLKFSSPSEAAKAIETVKEYKREGLELTVKFFAEDDSEGNIELYPVRCQISINKHSDIAVMFSFTLMFIILVSKFNSEL